MDREPGGPADDAGPPFARPGPPSLSAALLVTLLLAGCGAARGGGTPPDEEPVPPDGRPEPERPAPAPEAADVLEHVRALASSEPARALHLADSLYFALRARSDAGLAPRSLALQVRAALATGDTAGATARLRELLSAYPDAGAAADAASRLAELLRARGDDPAAAGVLLRHGDGGDRALALLRQAAGAMSVAELERAAALAEAAGAGSSARSVVAEELDRARELAGRAGPVRVGVLLPDSGRFAEVARWLRQGIRIAVEEGGEGPPVELVARDLSSGSPAGLLADLEAQGVAAVVGPLRAGGLADAARARSGPGLLLVSPTAAETGGLRNVYAFRDRSRRELDAAAVLGDWVGGRVRPGPVGAVYPRGDLGRRTFLRFRRALGEAGGGWIVASAAYDPGATTLEEPVTEVSAFRPEAVYAGAEGTSSLLQMAPQLAYYGIRAALVVGGPDWTRPGAVRRLDPIYSQLRVGAAFAGTGEGESGRDRFRAAYETRYRTTLGDNVLPMLGHDAALLVRRALAETSPPRPRAVARAFGRLAGVEGATGLLEPDPGTGAVGRRIALRALADRRLRPVSASEAREWLASTGRLATAGDRGRRARARRAVRDAGIPLEPQESQGAEGGEEPR